MTDDVTLLRLALERSGLSTGAFAEDVLIRDPRTVRRWLEGSEHLPPVVVKKLRALVARAEPNAPSGFKLEPLVVPLDHIAPALTAEEWANERKERSRDKYYERPFEPAKCIAVANDELPDGDPRKIAQRWIEVLRIARDAGRIEGGVGDDPIRYAGRPLHFGEQVALKEIADALESYLPPAGEPAP